MVKVLCLTGVTLGVMLGYVMLMLEDNPWALALAFIYSSLVFVTMAEWVTYLNERREKK